MNLTQQFLARAASDLGVRVHLGYALHLHSGRVVHADAYFPDLGSPLGTLVVESEDQVREATAELYRQGYAVSIFGHSSPSASYDVRDYAEIFTEWGWAGPSNLMPSWMVTKS